MKDLRFAILGTGFWSQFQLAAWRELEGVECLALYNRTRSKADALAQRFGIPVVYDDPRELLRAEEPDFVDIITSVEAREREPPCHVVVPNTGCHWESLERGF